MKETGNKSFSVPNEFLQLHPSITGSYCGYIDIAKKMIENIEPEVIQNIAKSLGLSFVPEKEKEGEVCFINSEEVRPEFRLSFAPVDVADYVYAVLNEPSYKKLHEESNPGLPLEVPYPKDATNFWGFAKTGEKLRQGR